jgi:lactoylglutathione lyase
MRIEHIAIWTDNIESLRNFYQTYFNMTSGEKYVNHTKRFTSYFLSFGEDKTRIELMNKPDISDTAERKGVLKGLAHFAISVGSEANVNKLTKRLRADGHIIESEPRITGDGYYESVVLDPDGNHIEITV